MDANRPNPPKKQRRTLAAPPTSEQAREVEARMLRVLAGGQQTQGLTLGDRLKIARLRAGIKQQSTMAEIGGVSRVAISDYERGAVVPTRFTLLAWSAITGCNLHWLETGEGEPSLSQSIRWTIGRDHPSRDAIDVMPEDDYLRHIESLTIAVPHRLPRRLTLRESCRHPRRVLISPVSAH